jgi:hypothetical protein
MVCILVWHLDGGRRSERNMLLIIMLLYHKIWFIDVHVLVSFILEKRSLMHRNEHTWSMSFKDLRCSGISQHGGMSTTREHRYNTFRSHSVSDINELNLPKTCNTEFPDPDDLLTFKLIICPDEVRCIFNVVSKYISILATGFCAENLLISEGFLHDWLACEWAFAAHNSYCVCVADRTQNI